MATTRIGISGWRYPPWRGVFYPKDLVQRDELAHASRQFPTIEINGSFYALQTPSSYGNWADATPADFVFSVKAPRYITHLKRLREVETPLANFWASGLLRLGAKLGPILWQFPPSFSYDPELMETFFARLPHTTAEAAEKARAHDSHLRAPAWLEIDKSRPLRHAIEIRHRSFESAEFVAQLRRHHVAIVVADTAGRWPLMEDLSADFVYVRLHGDKELYVSGYTEGALDDWARKISAWQKGTEVSDAKNVSPAFPPRKTGRDIFVYFDNDVKVRAPHDARTLAHKLGLGPPPVELDTRGDHNQPRLHWAPVRTHKRPEA